MHDMKLILGGVAFWVASLYAFGLLLLWIAEMWSPPATRNNALFWTMLWPIMWGYSSMTGRYPQFDSSQRRSKGDQSKENRATTPDRKPRSFRTIREAKDYLVSRIEAEAALAGTPPTEIERKMLYFSETGWTLPEMKQVGAEFDQNYDQDEYEKKIGTLVARIQGRDEAEDDYNLDCWDSAMMKLSQGDHYLSVLAGETPAQGKMRPLWQRLLAVLALFGFMALWRWSEIRLRLR